MGYGVPPQKKDVSKMTWRAEMSFKIWLDLKECSQIIW